MLGRCDEIGESVFLVEQLALIVPGAAHLLPATNVRDCVDESAIEETQIVVAESRISAASIRSVRIEQHRSLPIFHERLSIYERNRHHRAIGCTRPCAL